MLSREVLNLNSILIIGKGGREDSIAQKIHFQNPQTEIFLAPGNGGTLRVGKNLDLLEVEIDQLVQFASDNKIGRTIVGSELPLSQGVVDAFNKENLPILGPTQEAARLETDKVFALRFMQDHGIPHPFSEVSQNYQASLKFLKSFYFGEKYKAWGDLVIKFPGLAGGKGVILPDNFEQADNFISDVYNKDKFGQASNLIFQERLIGDEISMMFLTDGLNVFPLLPTRDYKRLKDNDEGSNTGGMGAYSPKKIPKYARTQIRDIARKTVNGLRLENKPIKGILTFDLMMVNGNIFVLETNVRPGDPQMQNNLAKLESNLISIFDSTIDRQITPSELIFDQRYSATIVLASKNYPDSISKGSSILIPKTLPDKTTINYAGVDSSNGNLITNGGRILCVTVLRDTLSQAAIIANQVADEIIFDGSYHRRDIGELI